MDKILTDFQKQALKEIGRTEISSNFIWSGGTALSYFYLQHRESHDLDFLSYDLFPNGYILTEIKKISENLKIKNIEERKEYNRHQFWLKRGKDILKLEFVFYPFPSVKKPRRLKEFNLMIDSMEDILTNKAHALYERNEPKDVFDFYYILQKKNIKFLSVLQWVKKKFGVEIDPVLFVSKVLEGVEKLDQIKPLVFKTDNFDLNEIKDYFKKEANLYLKTKIK